MLVPREYQTWAVDGLEAYFDSGKLGHPLVLMPTGTGKSVVIALFLLRMLLKYGGTRALVLTHVETLISQNFAKLLEVWPTAPAGINSAALDRRDTQNPIIFAGIQSVYKLAAAFGIIDFIIIDEAHLVGTKDEAMYVAFINELKKINPRLRVIGTTATDWRLGLGKLTNGNIFTDVAVDMTTPEWWDWFVDQGYLSPLISKRTEFRMSNANIRMSGGEYVLASQQEELDKKEITEKACKELLWWGETEMRKMCMIFATGVAHCEHVAEMMRDLGVSAIAIHSKTKKARDVIEDYKRGSHWCAVSMNKLTTGVDAPGIDLIGIMRFSESSALHVQMLGRGTRPVYGEVLDMEPDPHSQVWRLKAIQAGSKPMGCRVCDFAHNTERLGPINDPVIPAVKKKGSGAPRAAGPAPVRVCPNCADYVHHSKQVCPCGYDFGFTARIEAEASDREAMTRANSRPDPVTEIIVVKQVTYNYHKRRNSDKPPSMRVTYYLENLLQKPLLEFICFEHGGAATTRANNWWIARVPEEGREHMPVPATIAEAMKTSQWLRIPKRLLVWTNAEGGPRIMDHYYD